MNEFRVCSIEIFPFSFILCALHSRDIKLVGPTVNPQLGWTKPTYAHRTLMLRGRPWIIFGSESRAPTRGSGRRKRAGNLKSSNSDAVHSSFRPPLPVPFNSEHGVALIIFSIDSCIIANKICTAVVEDHPSSGINSLPVGQWLPNMPSTGE